MLAVSTSAANDGHALYAAEQIVTPRPKVPRNSIARLASLENTVSSLQQKLRDMKEPK